MTVQLTDKLPITRTRVITDEGYLQATAAITRVGIQHYKGRDLRDLDPSLEPDAPYAVFRPPSVVFHKDTAASAALKPITITHRGDVDSTNHGRLSVGSIGETVEPLDKERLGAKIQITDVKVVDAIWEGLSEVSCGYACDVEQASGVHEGESYMFRFCGGMIINHLAIVDAGRCGETVRILDQRAEGLSMTKEKLRALLKAKGFTDAEVDRKVSGLPDLDITTAQLLDAVALSRQDVKETVADVDDAAYGKMMDRMMADEGVMGKMMDRMMDKLLSDEGFLEKMKAGKEKKAEKKDAADTTVEELAEKRVAVLAACDGLLPENFATKGVTDVEILRAAMPKVTDADPANMEEGYMRGLLDAVGSDRRAAGDQRADALALADSSLGAPLSWHEIRNLGDKK